MVGPLRDMDHQKKPLALSIQDLTHEPTGCAPKIMHRGGAQNYAKVCDNGPPILHFFKKDKISAVLDVGSFKCI